MITELPGETQSGSSESRDQTLSRAGKSSGIWSTRTHGLTPITNRRPSRAMWRMVATHESPVASVGATQMSIPWLYMKYRARGM